MKLLLRLINRYIPRIAIGQDSSLDIYKIETKPPTLLKWKVDEFNKIKRLSYAIDESILKLPFGLASFVRLIPFLGNYIVLCLNLLILYKTYTFLKEYPIKFQIVTLSQMMFNVSVDFGLGLIPIIGFFTTVAVKCNTRNLNILLNNINSY